MEGLILRLSVCLARVLAKSAEMSEEVRLLPLSANTPEVTSVQRICRTTLAVR
jgi:hypothetical protein